jgi:putative Ca2+/H+ antiporter (TMEM165/GDT1 family)
MLEAFAVSTGAVALGEIGDKTQLLALMLTARYKRPGAILAGIAVATLANHLLAGAVGAWVASLLSPQLMRWGLGLSFIAMAAWLLVPDRDDGLDAGRRQGLKLGVFGITLVAFFLAEMGDKTQLATVGLAAKFQADWLAVIAGSTLGLLLANAPVVWWGGKLLQRIPMQAVRIGAATLFALLGAAILAGLA